MRLEPGIVTSCSGLFYLIKRSGFLRKEKIMLDIFVKGGTLMAPLLIASIIALSIIVERGWVLCVEEYRSRHMSRHLREQGLEGSLLSTDLSSRLNGEVAGILREVRLRRQESASLVQERITLMGEAWVHRLQRGLATLHLIGRLSPLAGLMGTVLGMVEVFQSVATVEGPLSPALLAGGLWEALITTAAGMGIALPALFFHHFYQRRIDEMVHRLEQLSGYLLLSTAEKESCGISVLERKEGIKVS